MVTLHPLQRSAPSIQFRCGCGLGLIGTPVCKHTCEAPAAGSAYAGKQDKEVGADLNSLLHVSTELFNVCDELATVSRELV